MKASIVILNWKGKYNDCLEAIESAIAQTYQDKEIIFVDNGSHDDTLSLLKKQFPDLIYIELPENLGVTGGRNRGAAASTGDLIFFLENDGAWATENVIEGAVQLFKNNAKLAVLYTAVEGYHTGKKDPAVDPYNRPDKGPLISSSFRGGAAIIRTSLFNTIGGFPNEFFRQAEEKFFSIFTYDLGYLIAYEPSLIMRHKGSDYQGKQNVVSWYGCINDLKTIIRHYPNRSKYLVVLFKYILWLIRFIKNCQFSKINELSKIIYLEIINNSSHKKASAHTISFIEELNIGLHGDILLDNFDADMINKPSNKNLFLLKISNKLKPLLNIYI